MSDIVYLIWSNKHRAWWRPGDWGYTTEEGLAGRYTETEAIERVIRSAHAGRVDQASVMVAAADNWTTDRSMSDGAS